MGKRWFDGVQDNATVSIENGGKKYSAKKDMAFGEYEAKKWRELPLYHSDRA
jgi:hypothetical protein